MEKTKVRVKIGFRYDIDAVVEAVPGWKDRMNMLDIEEAKVKTQNELDFLFSDDDTKGVISDFVIETEEVKE